MIETIASGILLGLSTGLFCLASCAPIMVPFMLGEKRNLKKIVSTTINLSIGRLCAYILIGTAVGIFAANLEENLFHKIGGAALVLVSVLLLLYTFSLIPIHPRFCGCNPKIQSNIPVLFGFLTGINICPPFLLAISYAISLGNLLGSILLFLGFFIGTSIYLVLLIPVGYVGKYENFRVVGRITAILSSIVFFFVGIGYIVG
ncbi:sulfite exporter TauE/SafE family protein [Methanospirillum lacunae]|uniref:Urease accessory protein UreH-like transmembrane domain-containing protein n=1 Tax=Methanospirillum lacunae TaxID=668570 RepID=A0A2V2MWP0_9EURY|nr:sulfite exporter TauE/SafE family protein [Methanospirillum lacunae]PWR69826.1 hypothetical protein DK846_16755 [Methanospirillum lacunae]